VAYRKIKSGHKPRVRGVNKMRLQKRGNLGVVNAVISFALLIGIMVYVFGVLGSSLNDSNTQSFFSTIVDKLTSTTSVIGAVIVLGILALIFVVIPMFRR